MTDRPADPATNGRADTPFYKDARTHFKFRDSRAGERETRKRAKKGEKRVEKRKKEK